MRNVLLGAIEIVTGAPRYAPEIEWARSNWTHNAFRAWEYVAGRRFGIRREWSLSNGKLRLYTFEARVAYAEGLAREAIRRVAEAIRGISVRVEASNRVPASPGFNHPGIPGLYLAIARDTSNYDAGASGSASRSRTLTCSGSDRVLAAFPYNDGTTLTVNSFTYDGASMGSEVGDGSTANGDIRSYVKVAPSTTGGASLAITYSSSTYIFLCAIAYTGAAQTGQPDAHGEDANASSAASISVNVTTVANNSWIAGVARHDNGGTISATGAFVLLQQDGSSGVAIHDTNGPITPAALTAVGSSSTANGGRYLAAVSISPQTSVTYQRSMTQAVAHGASRYASYGRAYAAVRSFSQSVAHAASRFVSYLGVRVSDDRYTARGTSYTNRDTSPGSTYTDRYT